MDINSIADSFKLHRCYIEPERAYFPIMGNHDYDDPNRDGSQFLSFFPFLKKIYGNSSGQQKYYDFLIGDCHFFILDSEPVCGGPSHLGLISEGVGKGVPFSTSNTEYENAQRQWFNNAIKSSTAKRKFVFHHHPPFNSGSFHKSYPKISPFKGWKTHLADFVFSGHEHLYERITSKHSNFPLRLFPSHVLVSRSGNQLTVDYKSNGALFGTSQLRIHIGNDNWQNLVNANTTESFMTKIGFDTWRFIYNIPQNADHINFAFRSNGGTWENNIINGYSFDYIYYLNDSNDIENTTYIIVGNGGIDLRTFGQEIVGGSVSRIDNAYGFSVIDVFENGIKYNHLGIKENSEVFQVLDSMDTTPISGGGKKITSFAVIADWGQSNNPNFLEKPSNFRSPGSNYYAYKISEDIKNKGIKYVFAVGDQSYNGLLYRQNEDMPFYLDQNVGQFYYDYINFYRGLYEGLNSFVLYPNGLQDVNEKINDSYFIGLKYKNKAITYDFDRLIPLPLSDEFYEKLELVDRNSCQSSYVVSLFERPDPSLPISNEDILYAKLSGVFGECNPGDVNYPSYNNNGNLESIRPIFDFLFIYNEESYNEDTALSNDRLFLVNYIKSIVRAEQVEYISRCEGYYDIGGSADALVAVTLDKKFILSAARRLEC